MLSSLFPHPDLQILTPMEAAECWTVNHTAGLVMHILSTRDSLYTPRSLPDLKATSSHPEMKKQQAGNSIPSRAARTAISWLGAVPSHVVLSERCCLPQPRLGDLSSPRPGQRWVGCSHQSCTAKHLLPAAGHGPSPGPGGEMGLLEWHHAEPSEVRIPHWGGWQPA